MKIAVIQASSQKDKNRILEQTVKESVDLSSNEIINFGVFPEEETEFSYVQTAICVSALLESKAVDFVVTGCSSGQGMMLACNSLPGVLCGYIGNPSDAFLFGRINDGNAVSFPLGLNWGWAGEIALKSTMKALFSGPFGCGYPDSDAKRKQKDTKLLKYLNSMVKRTWEEALPLMDDDYLKTVFQRKKLFDFIVCNGTNESFLRMLQKY